MVRPVPAVEVPKGVQSERVTAGERAPLISAREKQYVKEGKFEYFLISKDVHFTKPSTKFNPTRRMSFRGRNYSVSAANEEFLFSCTVYLFTSQNNVLCIAYIFM